MNYQKKILFISYDGMTDALGQSQVIPYLIGLTKEGYTFLILSCDKSDKYKENKLYVEKMIAPYPITWISLPYHKKPPILSSIYDFLKLRQKAKQLYQIHKFDMVHTRPGIPQLVALYLKKKFNIKFMNDIRGFWADERVDGDMWNLNNAVYKKLYSFFKKKEYESIRKADYNTCLTYKGKEEILKWSNVPQPVKVEVVPCSVDLNLFNNNNIEFRIKEGFKRELNISNSDFIISYLGSIGGWYLTKEMLQFCSLLLQKKPESKFLFISNNNQNDIITMAAEYGISKEKIIVKHAKRHEVPILLSLSTYSLFFIKPCYSKLASSPTKHGEIMAMGIPVITNSGVGDVKEIVEKYNAGYVLNDFTEQTMMKVVNAICANPVFDKNEIRKGALDFYNLEKTVKIYKAVYEKALS